MAYSEITWPVSLPQGPLVDSYGETPDYDVIVTDMDAGPKRQRRRSSAGTESRSVKYLLKWEQKATMKDFLDGNAGRSFWWPDPTADVYRYVRVKGDSEIQFAPVGARHWYVTMTLEIWPYVSRNK